MNPRPWQRVSQTSLLNIPPWLEVFRQTFRLPNGGEIDDFYTVQLPDAAVVAALTPELRVVTERHYRPGADQVTVTLPAGFLQPGETPLQGAQRELREETGFESTQWTNLGKFIVDGNRGCGSVSLFLAHRAVQTYPPDGRDLAEIVIETTTIDELLDMINTGGAIELATAAAIGMAALRLHR